MGATQQVVITELSRTGAGIARTADGRTLFIPWSAPGDELRVSVPKTPDKHADLDFEVIIRPSQNRVEPPCPVFGKCGGCQWQHIHYDTQWKAKWTYGLNALKRRDVSIAATPDLFPSSHPYHYRNRIQLRVEGDKVGFYARMSHQLVEISRCEIAEPTLNDEISKLKEELRANPFPTHGKVELSLLESGEVRRTRDAPHGADGFRQIHSELNGSLQTWIRSHLKARDELFDLFGGNGNLSQPLVDRFSRIDCVDLGSPVTKPPGTPGHLFFHRADVVPWLRKQKTWQRGKTRAAVIDPPRAGLGDSFKAIEGQLRRLGVTEVIAVGCDSESWARDVSLFRQRGWQITHLAFFDFFPQTPHFESVVRLTV